MIIITGTPGVGKTTLAKWLAKELSWKRVDISYFYEEISVNYDEEKKCFVVDLEKFEDKIKEFIAKKGNKIIIDSHISHLLPPKMADLCIVLTCSDLKELEKRLKKKKYSKKKIRENLDAEIFQVCLVETNERKHKLVTFDTSKGIPKKEIMSQLEKNL